jgi:hypothetical protein
MKIHSSFLNCAIEPSFLQLPSSEWKSEVSYVKFCSTVNRFSPLNDAGERAVKFESDYHGLLDKDAVQHESVLQNVEEHRRMYPKATKTTFDSELNLH